MPNVELTILKENVTVVSYNPVAHKLKVASFAAKVEKQESAMSR